MKTKKMKQWKVDFYRDQDREKMQVLSNRLRAMRKKQSKSTSNTRKIISSHPSKSTKGTNSSKASNRRKGK